ncbi:NAD dependent epimerase/dehydratase family protein [Necator americanus]|uniref:Protein HTATIP2 n=1 Tax=Necator americanus TaxID=51031 RepID=W2TUX6_NECAM|nr:NAD dependent epimerase/dehydratase family protein [Necator americanus]ETN84866.1 NAD dependent epimerase/dehydratase family protein [Necator americanus]
MLKSAFVLGATGAVGSQLVDALVKSRQFKRIVVVGRRKIPLENDSIEQVIVDFDAIEKHADAFKDTDIGFCALGTTRGKAGKEGFYKVDHDYVVNSAKVAKEQGKFPHFCYIFGCSGVKEFVLVSAAGSNENSFFLYPKTKGETERDIAVLGFEKFLIMRPGLLEGPREESRLGESIAKVLVKPLKLLSNSIAISTEDVAKAMVVGGCSSDLKGKVIWDNATMIEKKASFDDLCK